MSEYVKPYVEKILTVDILLSGKSSNSCKTDCGPCPGTIKE